MSPTAAPLPPADPIRALPPLTDDFDVQDGPGGNHDGIPHRGRGAGEPALRGQFPHQRANSSRRIGHLEREASHLQIAAIDEPEDERLAKRLRPRIDQHHTGAPVRSTAGDVGKDCRGRGRVAYPGLPDKAAPRACGTAGSCGRGVAGLGALATPAGGDDALVFPSPQAGPARCRRRPWPGSCGRPVSPAGVASRLALDVPDVGIGARGRGLRGNGNDASARGELLGNSRDDFRYTRQRAGSGPCRERCLESHGPRCLYIPRPNPPT